MPNETNGRYAAAVPVIEESSGLLVWEVLTYTSITDRQPSGVLPTRFYSHAEALDAASAYYRPSA